MKRTPSALVPVIALILATLLCTTAAAELRFGPWVHFAPYYLPDDGTCNGVCLSMEDLAPRYQSPNPLPPPTDGYCPPPSKPIKVTRATASRSRLSPPLRSEAMEPGFYRGAAGGSLRGAQSAPPAPPRSVVRADLRPRQIGSVPGRDYARPPQY